MRPIDADALIEFCAERWIPLNIDAVNMQPTIQLEKAQLSKEGTTSDMVSRQEALDALRKCQTYLYDARDPELKIELSSAEAAINNLPTIQPEKRTEERMETHACDLISRQALCEYALNQKDKSVTPNDIMRFPSAQPERTCVNCGRTVNNGGWYADGGTRCPIEEHYALPKDGYCHLWEKRNVTDDDYLERRTDETD